MAVGQVVLSGVSDALALRAAEDVLERAGADAGRVHARLLRSVLVVHRGYSQAGMGLSVQSQVALLLRTSEWRAGRLLTDACALAELPEAFEALEWGLLTVEQSAVLAGQLAPLPPPERLVVWQRLLDRLRADLAQGTVRPPARLAELLRRWVIEADPDAAEDRRRQAEQDRRVDYRRREDGLGDLFLMGFRGPQLQTILSRIAERSAPYGADDLRSADQRRFDAVQDMLLGRDLLTPACPGAGCGCRAGQGAPCGSQVQVLVTLAAALGRSDEPAELVGHGPIEPDLLQQLLRNAPRLTPVFTDQDGVPVALGDPVEPPDPDDPAALRQALLALVRQAPAAGLHPRHPHDHPAQQPPEEQPPAQQPAPPPPKAARLDPPRQPTGPGGEPRGEPPGEAALNDPPVQPAHPVEQFVPEPVGRASRQFRRGGGRHPDGVPGPYKVAGRLRKLLFVRAPRCEFPGCGARAVRCDAEHDLAWPDGPTCACNLGPCCRRHHRVKQEGWTKTRGLGSAVTWASPSGRQWLSPSQHQPPAPAVRPLPALPAGPNPLDELSPTELEHELWWLAGCPDDPDGLELRAADTDPDNPDDHDRLLHGDTRWTLDLTDPYRWLDQAAFT